MSDKDLFDNTDQGIDETKDYLAELVGEDKPYKDAAALAKAVAFKQHHIENLETETKGLREELTGRQRLQDLVEKLASAQKPPSEDTGNQSGSKDDNRGNVLNSEDLRKLAREEVLEQHRSVQRAENLKAVDKICREKLGPNYSTRLKQQATALGMDPSSLNDVAANNPQVFYRIMGLDRSQEHDSGLAPPSGVNTTGLVSPKRTEEFYKELRKKDPVTYWSPKIQNELHAMKAKEMGLG